MKWLAPLTSLGLLALLIARVSSCDAAPRAEATRPAASHARFDAGLPEPPAHWPGPRDSLQFLGASKAAPMVVGDALDLQNAEPQREAPAQRSAHE